MCIDTCRLFVVSVSCSSFAFAFMAFWKRRTESKCSGPYWREGTAPPMQYPKPFSLPARGDGIPGPELRDRPDTWLKWPHLDTNQESQVCSSSMDFPKAQTRQRQPKCLASASGSAQLKEDELCDKWVSKWACELEPWLVDSPSFSPLGKAAVPSPKRILQGKAAATLRKHFPGWRRWCTFAWDQQCVLVNPPLQYMVKFFQALAGAKHGVSSCASALRFVAGVLGISEWSAALGNPVIVAWCSGNAYRQARKEALPLPLVTVAMFEEAVLEDMKLGVFSRDTALLTGFLMMLWGALRFSDLQRVRIPDLEVGHGAVRGECWRTKSARCGMPFGFLTAGIRGDWGSAVATLKSHLAASDFVFQAPPGGCASFSFVLGNLRRLLTEKGHVPEKLASNYSLHSLKVTGLFWALQVDVDAICRRCWGHHRAKESGERMAAKYSRDDVLPALRAQLKVLRSIRAGWCPLTPQARGSKEPLKEVSLINMVASPLALPAGLEPLPGHSGSDTEKESSNSSFSSSSSSADTCGGEVSGSEVVVKPGIFLINRMTGCFHAAVAIHDRVGRACAPLRCVKAPHWESTGCHPVDIDDELVPCSHAACAAHLCL